MLKPSATKLAQANDTQKLVAAFIKAGGKVTKEDTGVAMGLLKKKYVKRK